MTIADRWGQLFTYGFVQIIDKNLLNLSSKKNLEHLQKFIEQTYLKEISNNFKLMRCGRWQGVDTNTQHWHNDSKEGHNISFLLYLDSCSPELGGQLEIKSDDSLHSIYPEPGLLVCLNQKEKFSHRAMPSKATRRVVSFDYYLAELDEP